MKFIMIGLDNMPPLGPDSDGRYVLLSEKDVDVVDLSRAAAMLLGDDGAIVSDQVRGDIVQGLNDLSNDLSREG